MIDPNELLEAVAESLRQSRRSYVRAKFDIPYIRINVEKCSLELDVIDNGQKKLFELVLKNADTDTNTNTNTTNNGR